MRSTTSRIRPYAVLGLLILLGAAGLYGFYQIKALDILPGFEGMQGGVYGERPQSTTSTVPLGVSFPQSPFGSAYSWSGSPTPSSATVDASTAPIVTCPALSCDNYLVLDAQTNPVSSTLPFSNPQQVNYYVPVPGQTGQYELVTGQVEYYTYNLDISIQSGSAGTWNFGGDTIWYNLLAVDWNQASVDPYNPSITGSVYEVPLYAVVNSVNWHDQGSAGCDACVQGHAFTFYSGPSVYNQTLATLAGSTYSPSSTNVNSTLAGIYRPDTRFPADGLVYYPISLSSFAPHPVFGGDCALGCQYPSVQLTIQLYTLRIGEYIVTNPSTTSLGSRSQSCTGLSCATEVFTNFGAWVAANPALAGIIAALGVGVVIFIVLAVFATPVILAIIYLAGRGRRAKS